VSRKGWLLFLAMCLIWGVPYLLIRVAVQEVSPVVLVFARCAIGALLLIPIVLQRRELAGLKGKAIPIVAFATAEILGPWLFLSDAERTLDSSLAGLLIATVPIMGVVLAWGFGDRTRVSGVRWAGLFLGLAGVALLAGPELGGGRAWPIIEVLLTALGYATAPIIADRYLRGVPTLALTAVCLGGAALVYLVPAVLNLPPALPGPSALAALATLGVICTALAFVLFLQLIAEVGPARATVITYVHPAVAVALGAAVLGEALTVEIGLAFVLILVGSVLATRGPSAKSLAAASGADDEVAVAGEGLGERLDVPVVDAPLGQRAAQDGDEPVPDLGRDRQRQV
jgi:drug/metabolite transporter (DMT)-like permease